VIRSASSRVRLEIELQLRRKGATLGLPCLPVCGCRCTAMHPDVACLAQLGAPSPGARLNMLAVTLCRTLAAHDSEQEAIAHQ
jgi:hypothetical protein